MKVFISWSGERSKHVAESFRSWLPKVIQAIEPWMSQEDISSGTRWLSEVSSELEVSKVGIICVTPENQSSPWIMFEAGALSKTINKTFVCPYLYDVNPSQITGPLSHFQSNFANKEGTKKILTSLNNALTDKSLKQSELDEIFDVWWPKLEEKINQTPRLKEFSQSKRTSDDLLEEIVENTREQLRREEIRLLARKDKDHQLDKLMMYLEGMKKQTIKIDSLKNKLTPIATDGQGSNSISEILNDLGNSKNTQLGEMIQNLMADIGNIKKREVELTENIINPKIENN